jgi:drug/metabolite transporter (DMT)-like permease
MNGHLSLTQLTLLVAYAGGMVAGQILFKLAALRAPVEGPLGDRLVGMTFNGFFGAAVLLYAGLTVLWVWILTFTPLSRAYVFVALAFAVTPALAALLFAEPITVRLMVGIALICAGLLLVTG